MYYKNDREMIKNACSIQDCLTQNSDIFNEDSKNVIIMIVTSYSFFVIQHDLIKLTR